MLCFALNKAPVTRDPILPNTSLLRLRLAGLSFLCFTFLVRAMRNSTQRTNQEPPCWSEGGASRMDRKRSSSPVPDREDYKEEKTRRTLA